MKGGRDIDSIENAEMIRLVENVILDDGNALLRGYRNYVFVPSFMLCKRMLNCH